MPRKNLTARFVESVKVESRTDFFDDTIRGLVLRVSPTGVKAWTVVYSRDSDSTKRRVTIGKFPAITLEKARSKALAIMSAVSEGEDPAGAKQARRASMTVEELGCLFIDKYSKRTKKTWAEDERLLKVEVYPKIGKLKAIAVKRRDILDIIEDKAEAGYGAQSNSILAVTRKLFNWAVDGDYLEVSPAAGVKPRAKAVRRDRVLSDDELALIWKALPGASFSATTANVLRLLILTGQRSGEVCGMMRSEVDIVKSVWTIPGARTKNGLTHVVPLTDAAFAIVEAACNATDQDEPDAPLWSKIGEPVESNAIAQAVRLKLQVVSERWTPHDLRRTVATGMAGIGIQPHIIEACLNHISGFRGGVAGVYNRAAYEPEKWQAFERWAAHVDSIISGKKKVVPIRKREA